MYVESRKMVQKYGLLHISLLYIYVFYISGMLASFPFYKQVQDRTS